VDLLGSELAIVATHVVSFLVTFLVISLAGRILVIPFLGRVMERRGLDRHAKVPLVTDPTLLRSPARGSLVEGGALMWDSPSIVDGGYG
jgi:hypothetical protein